MRGKKCILGVKAVWAGRGGTVFARENGTTHRRGKAEWRR